MLNRISQLCSFSLCHNYLQGCNIKTILGVFLEAATGVPPRTLPNTRGTRTSAMGLRAAAVGTTGTGSGLYGLSDELFTYLSIEGGAGGCSPLLKLE